MKITINNTATDIEVRMECRKGEIAEQPEIVKATPKIGSEAVKVAYDLFDKYPYLKQITLSTEIEASKDDIDELAGMKGGEA